MRLAFVVLRYGESIVGGAEHLTRKIAEAITHARLAQVDVLTTCATVHYRPSNDLPAGVTMLNGVRVLRFPINLDEFDLTRHQVLASKQAFNAEGLTEPEENEWARHMTFSSALCAYLDAHQDDYDAIIVIPYFYSLHAALVAPAKTYVWACLHDEPPAYAGPVIDMLNRSRGVIFNSEPELALARRLGMRNPNTAVVAIAVEPLEGSRTRFESASPNAAPFVTFAGRLEEGKSVKALYELFSCYKEQYPNNLCLRVVGNGPDQPPQRPDMIFEGFVRPQRKADVIAASVALVAPSRVESLSLVILEGWTLSVPSIVNGQCEVMRYQVKRCSGGIDYGSQEEFNQAIETYRCNAIARHDAGAAGRRFVRQHYNWQRVLADFLRLIC